MTVAPVSIKLAAVGPTDSRHSKDDNIDSEPKDDPGSKEALMILGIDRGVALHVTADLVKEDGMLSASAVTL
ncbi:hypothetical protein BDW62DRAFT_186982 [Aspergillus aurantiobrunneus]